MRILKVLLFLIIIAVLAGAGGIYYLTKQPPKQLIENNIKKFTGYTAHLNGDVSLSLWPKLDVKITGIKVDAFFGEAPLFTGDNLKFTLAPWAKIWHGLAVENVEIDNPTINLIQPKTGLANWESPWKKGNKSSGEITFIPVASMQINNLNFNFEDAKNHKNTNLKNTNITIAGANESALKLSAKGLYNNKNFDINGGFDIRNFDNLPITLTAKLPALNIVLEGDVKSKSAFVGRVKLTTPQVLDVLNNYASNMEIPVKLTGPAKISASGVFSANSINLHQLNVLISNAIKLSANSFKVEPLKHNFATNLEIENLNLTRMGLCSSAKSGKSKGGSPWSDTPINTDFLQTWNLNLDINMPSLNCASAPFNSAKIVLKNNRKNLNINSLDLFSAKGGKISVNLNASIENRLKGDINISLLNLPVEEFLSGKLKQKTQIPLNGNIKLNFKGNTTQAMASSLNGSVNIFANEGTLPGSALTSMALSLEKSLAGLANTQNDLDKIIIKYQVENGIARAETVHIRTANGQIDLQATGKIDLANWTIVHRVEPVVNASTAFKIPMNIKGSLSSPRVIPEIANIQNLATGAGALIGGPVGAAAGKFLGDLLGGNKGKITKETSATTVDKNAPINPLEQLLKGL